MKFPNLFLEKMQKDDWYSGGLVHDDFKCVYTKDLLNNF